MNFWTLNRLIVLILIGVFAGLLFEIRAEHQDVLGEHAIGWTPIIYSGLMIILSFAALFFWQRGGTADFVLGFRRRLNRRRSRFPAAQ